MRLEYCISVVALLLTYGCIYLCQCRQRSGNSPLVALLILAATAIPVFVGVSRAGLYLAVLSLIILGYFEFHYERRLRAIGRIANELSDTPEQGRLLLLLVGEIAEHLCGEDFHFYSERIGRKAFLALAAQSGSIESRVNDDEALCHALRFAHADIMGKWGNPSRSHSVSLLLERINRNVLFYVATAKSGNMADIRNAARHNLRCLLAIYQRNFYLQKGKAEAWSSATDFAVLRQQFDTELTQFPVRMELA